MRRVLTIGVIGIGIESIAPLINNRDRGIVIVSSKEESKNITPFDNEPIKLYNKRLEGSEDFYYEPEPSKFVSKPKNNFRRR